MPRSTTAERRRLALGRAAAAKILADPALLAIGRHNLPGLIAAAGSLDGAALLQEWERLIDAGAPAVARVLAEDSEHGHDMRQQSPFAGVLTDPERWAVLDTVYARKAG